MGFKKTCKCQDMILLIKAWKQFRELYLKVNDLICNTMHIYSVLKILMLQLWLYITMDSVMYQYSFVLIRGLCNIVFKITTIKL